MYDLLLKNARRSSDGLLRSISVSQGKIVALGEDPALSAGEVIDLKGRVVLPGFIEGHIHLDKALTGNELPNRSGSVEEAFEITREFEKRATQKDIYQRAHETALWALRCGTTSLRTHVNISPSVELKGLHAMLELRDHLAGTIDVQIVALASHLVGDGAAKTRDLLNAAMQEGADAVGGVSLADSNPQGFVDEVFRIAIRHGRPLDLHVDESGSPCAFVLDLLADRTLAEGYQGRVIAGHCCSLAVVDDRTAAITIKKVARAQITVATLPATNLYLQGRGEPHPVRRGLTRVKELIAAGVNVFCGTDNIKDMFNPFGRPDLLLCAHMLGHAAQMGSLDEQTYLLESITKNPAAGLGIECGIAVGAPADIVVLDTHTCRNILADLPSCYLVFKGGRAVAGNGELYRRRVI